MIEKAHSKLIEHGTTLNREQRQELIDELLILFNVVGQSEQLKLFYKYLVKQGLSPDIDDDFLQQQIDNFNLLQRLV